MSRGVLRSKKVSNTARRQRASSAGVRRLSATCDAGRESSQGSGISTSMPSVRPVLRTAARMSGRNESPRSHGAAMVRSIGRHSSSTPSSRDLLLDPTHHAMGHVAERGSEVVVDADRHGLHGVAHSGSSEARCERVLCDPTALLAAQDAGRIEVGGAQGGHDARKHRDRYQQQGHGRERDRVGGVDAEQERREEAAE